MNTILHYVVDDGGVFNVFSSDMFDSLGRYYEDASINFRDLDIVARHTDMDKAFEQAERLNEIYNE